jgi:hypothetical protein
MSSEPTVLPIEKQWRGALMTLRLSESRSES